MANLKWKDVKKNAELKKLVYKFSKGEFNDENVVFLSLKLGNGTNFEDIYKKYIASGGKKEINIPSSLKRELEELAESEAWDDMLASMQQAQEELEKLLENDVLVRFKNSKEYEKYLEENPETRPRR